jgi:hypothetical protein
MSYPPKKQYGWGPPGRKPDARRAPNSKQPWVSKKPSLGIPVQRALIPTQPQQRHVTTVLQGGLQVDPDSIEGPAKIKHVDYLASYNWLSHGKRTIIVPGKSPRSFGLNSASCGRICAIKSPAAPSLADISQYILAQSLKIP